MPKIQVETFRLSPLQRHLCALQGTDPYSPYRTYCVVGITGSLDILRLQGAVEKAVERHEILHTVFPHLAGSSLPVQVIAENCSLPLAVYDLSAILWPEQEKIVPNLLDSLRSLPFYLRSGSLFQVSLVRRSHEDHFLLIAASALIADTYTCNLFIREVGQFYDMAFVDEGDQDEYVQYADMAEWQYELLESAETAPGRKYWQSTDYSCLTNVVFPTMRTVETSSPIAFDSVVQRFSAVFVAQTEALAQRLNVSVPALFLSCWLLVLGRITGQSDLFVGTGYDGRKYEELLGAVGLFTKYVPLPFHLSDESRFSECVRQIDERLQDASLWQEYFGWELLRTVDEKDPEPFCSLGFDCGALPPSVRLKDLVLSIEDQNTYLDRFHVRLSCVYSAQGLLTTLHYERQLFEKDAMERLLAQWQTVLVQVLEEPRAILRHLQVLPSSELHLLLQEWNATYADYPRHSCVHTLVDEQVRRSPDRIAVVYEDHQLTYHQLCSQANRLARYLQRQGVGPEVCVGLFLERSIEMLVALLGILKAGGAYVPLDTSYPQERLAFMLGNAKMPLFLTLESLLTKLPMTSAQAICLDRDGESIAQESADPPCSEVIAENLAYVIYTSGSTGQPKGVMAAHRELVNYLCWCTRTYDIVHGDGTLVHSSLSFDLTVTGLLSPLLVGSKVFLLPEGHGIEELSNVLQASSHLSLVKLTPAHLELLNKLLVPEMVNERTNAFIIGGEALYGASLSFWHRYAPNTRLINEYGPTETVVGCCVYEVPSETNERGPVPIGGPIANTRLYVLDDYHYPTSIGVPGELYIGGEGLTRGYMDRPELTAERFIPDPFSTSPGQRLYRTGDLVHYLHDGNLTYLGRLDHQVKIRGFRIELAEIEAHLLEHPAIHEAVVVAQDDIPGDKRLVAYMVGSPAQVMPSTDDLRIYLQSKLPDYMVPSFFIALRKLPLTTNGKVDREALPAPGINRPDLNSLFVLPQTEVEAILASIWSEVLHIKQIGIYDNFFSIGGDSILSIQVAMLAKQAGLYVTPRQLFQYQTIVQLAGVATLNAKPSLVEPALVYGPVPLTPIQHWFFALDMPRRHHYNFSGLFEIHMRPGLTHLQQAIQLILQQHDALHLRFAYDEEGWHQYQSKPSQDIPFIIIDLSNLRQRQQATSIEALSSAAQESLNLTTGPLLRSIFFERGGLGSDCLLVVVHHLVVDGVSWRILLGDLETALSQIADDKDIRLPAKTSSFQYWSQKLQQYAQSELLQQELPYWLASKRAYVKSLPVDLSDDLNASIDSASMSVHLDIQQTQELLQNVSSAYHTQINDLLLTALIRAFAIWTGQRLLLVDFEGHGREESIDEIDLSHTIGWFTTIFPVLLDIEQATSIADEIKAVKEQLRQIPQHGIGYGVLRYLHPDADIRAQLASLPPAQVSFNYLGQFGSALSSSPVKEARLRRSSIPIGALYNSSGTRSHLLVINGSVMDGRLHFVWQYSRQIHRTETIQRLSQAFIDALHDIIVHCQLPGVEGYTPSDFPLAAFDQPTLDLLVRHILPIERSRHSQSIEDIYPLSPMQTGMLFHSLYTANGGVYHGQFGWIIEGDFNIWVWQWAWQQVVNRHSILRTLFLWRGLTEPVQVVMRDVQLPWVFYDWRGLTLPEQRALLTTLYQEDRQSNFDLEKAPLLRPTLIYLGERAYYFLLSQHHLLWDGWSQPLLFSEVQKLYHAYSHGSDYDLQPIRPYRDYIAWLQQQDRAGAEQFWRMYLAGFRSPTVIAADHCSSLGRGQTNNATGAQHLHLSEEKTSALQRLAQRYQLTMNTILQGAWGWLLALYSGEKEVIFGATVAGRPAEVTGVEAMIGLFINTLPVRIQITADTPVTAWLSQLQEQQVEMRQYEYTPLTDIQRWSNVPADRSLFEYLFLFQNYPLPPRQEKTFDGRELTPMATNELDIHTERKVEHTNYPLTVVAGVSQDTLVLKLSYDNTRFDDAFIHRLLGHFELVLEALGSQWHQRLADLPRLTKGEQELLLSTWNTTAHSAPEKLCLHHLFEARVISTPDTIAVQDEEQCFSYSFLNTQANQLAHLLFRMGVGPEVRVGICLERSYTQLVAVLGILKAGGAYVPLDPASPQRRLDYLCQDAQVSLIVTQQSLLIRLPESFPHILCLDRSPSSLLAQPCTNPDRLLLTACLAYIIYTSGSTGKPKGVLVTHQGITNLARAQIAAFAVQTESRVLQFASSSFDASVSEIAMALVSGATLCLVPAQTIRTGPDLWQLLVQQAITVVTLPPSVLATLPLEPLPVLSSLVVAGEACPPDLVARWSPGRQFYNAYGPTEGTVCATIALYQEHSETIPIGKPIANTEIYVLDSQLHLQPVGVSGELYLGGIGLARGYHQRPDMTAERFVPHPFSQEPGVRLYKTGDRVRFLPTGELIFLGRTDLQIKVRGVRVELEEIEQVLNAHPAVSTCVVIASQVSQENDIVAYILPREGQTPSISALRQYMLEQVPDLMVPSSFIVLRQFPLTLSGKVDREALPLADVEQRSTDEMFVPPRTALEEQLVSMWRELLQIQQVGIEDSFFELGGHSLRAAQFINRLQALLGVTIYVSTLFDEPTIAGLVAYLSKEYPEIIKERFGSASLSEGELQDPHMPAVTTQAQETQSPAFSPPLRSTQPQDTNTHEVQDGQHQLLPIPRVERGPHQHFPLSFAQQRLWFLDQLEPGSTVYLVSNAQRVAGRLHFAALEWSLRELAERHESLRTTFDVYEGQPVQVIHPTGNFPLPVVDMQGLKREEREKQVHRLVYQEKQQPCDLQRGPLLRLSLLRLDAEEHILLITVHHIISDGWSTDLFQRELITLYWARVAGRLSPLAPLPIQYADFAHWQRQWLQGAVLERQLAYWRDQLTGVSPLELPTDRPRPPVQTYRGSTQQWHLPAPLYEQLTLLSQQEHVTLFILLLAAFQVLLARYSGQQDIAVGTPIANRARSELEGLIGFFVNTLVMRTQVQGDLSFRQLLARVREAAMGAYAHQDVPFEQLVEMLQPERDLGRSTLFQVMFTLLQESIAPAQPSSPVDVQGLPLRLQGLQLPHVTTKFDLTFNIMGGPHGLYCQVEFCTDLFVGETIQRLLRHWQTLLEGIVAQPACAISDLPLLSERESRQILVEWNATTSEYQMNCGLHELFEAQVHQSPDAIALTFEDEQLTCLSLNQRANRVAHHLRACGVECEAGVGICLERSPFTIIAVLAILKAGGMYVPLDPRAPSERIAFLLQDARVTLVLTQQDLLEHLPAQIATYLYLDTSWQRLSSYSMENVPGRSHPSHAAYLLYTSGSTGQPKGVVVEHRQVVNYIAAMQEKTGLTAPASYAMLQPLTVDSCVTMLFSSLLTGGVLHIISYECALDAQALAQYFLLHQIDYLKIAPSHLFSLMAAMPPQRLLPRRKLIIGGEASQWQWMQQLQSFAPANTVYNHYGPTETTVGSLVYPIEQDVPIVQGALTPLGKPLANTQVYVLDRQLHPQPLGVIGELYIGGAGLARGYFGRPELTAEYFLPHPYSNTPGARFYRTGDMVRYQEDGTLEFVGRSDEQIKIRGYRIEPGEIEGVLMQHPAIREALVIAVADDARQKRLVAYLVAKEGVALAKQEAQEFLRRRLPEYMVPFSFLSLEAFPRTPHGKVDRKALLALAESQLPEAHELVNSQSSVVEEMMGGIWCQVLGIDHVDAHDNFFALGGHSLLAAQLISRIRSAFNVEIPLRWLFEEPVLSALARRVEGALHTERVGAEDPLVPVSRLQPLPLSFAQQRLWFLDQLEPGNLLYVIPGVQPLHGILDIGLLERSLEALVQRHESLRTTFQECKQGAALVQPGQPMQIIHPVESFCLPVIDLSSLALEARKNQVHSLPQQAMLTPFDLKQGPLLRAWILRLHADEHMFVVMIHHIISDGWSMNVFYHELRVLYQAFSTGQPSPLQLLPIQYADFAVWQRQQLQGELLEQQLDYWRQQLGGASPLILPADYSRPAVVSHRGAGQIFSLSPQLSQALITLSRQEDVTPFMLLLTAFQILFYRYSGQKDIVVGTDSANRNRVEMENLIGFFINVLALRTTWHETLPFRQMLRRVREMVLDAYTHQETPFELLVDKIVPDHALDQLPLVQVLFVMQNLPEFDENMAHGQGADERQKDAPMQPLGEREIAVKFDLALFMEEKAGQFYGSLNYRLDLFTARTIATMAERFATLLQSIVQQPDASIDQLDFLTVAERKQQVQKQQTLRSKLRSHKGTRFDLP